MRFERIFVGKQRENGLIKKVGSSTGGLKLSKKAGVGPKWWNHENDSSAARRGAAQDVAMARGQDGQVRAVRGAPAVWGGEEGGGGGWVRRQPLRCNFSRCRLQCWKRVVLPFGNSARCFPAGGN